MAIVRTEFTNGNDPENLKIDEVARHSVKYNILISLSEMLHNHVTTASKAETRKGLTDAPLPRVFLLESSPRRRVTFLSATRSTARVSRFHPRP